MYSQGLLKNGKKSKPTKEHTHFCNVQINFIEKASTTDWNQLSLFPWQNNGSLTICLPYNCISMASHAMGIDDPHEESITSRVQAAIMNPGIEHSFLLYPNFNQIFLEIPYTNKNLIKKYLSVIIFLINKAINSWFCFFFIIISEFFNGCNKICGIINNVG